MPHDRPSLELLTLMPAPFASASRLRLANGWPRKPPLEGVPAQPRRLLRVSLVRVGIAVFPACVGIVALVEAVTFLRGASVAVSHTNPPRISLSKPAQPARPLPRTSGRELRIRWRPPPAGPR